MSREGGADARGGLVFVLDPSLTALAYRCHPDGCPRNRTCCVGLVVEVSRRERRAIDTLMDELARLVPALRAGGVYQDVFIDDPPDVAIESREDGSCPFLMRTRRHALCSIHHLALQTGRRVEAVKPAACRHWPLALEADGGRVRIVVEPAAERMGCVAPVADLPGKPTVLDAFRDEIRGLSGAVSTSSGASSFSSAGPSRPRGEPSRGRSRSPASGS